MSAPDMHDWHAQGLCKGNNLGALGSLRPHPHLRRELVHPIACGVLPARALLYHQDDVEVVVHRALQLLHAPCAAWSQKAHREGICAAAVATCPWKLGRTNSTNSCSAERIANRPLARAC